MKYNFIFEGNKTNECAVHNRLFHIEKVEFKPNYRIDITDNEGFSYCENTGNDSFRKVVDTTKSIDEQINIWANYILEQYSICDICGNLEMVLQLKEYDYENFPEIRGKKVCDKCRTKLYNELLKRISAEEKNKEDKLRAEMKEQGAKYQYTFWVHPQSGDDFVIDIFTNGELTQTEINRERRKFITKYSARLVEEPMCYSL